MDNRTILFNMRLTPLEHKRLMCCAKKAGLSQSVYIRTLLAGYMPKETPPLDYYSLMKELKTIGNRMNQITEKANAIGFIDADAYVDNYDALWEMLLKINEAVVCPEKQLD